MGSITQRIKIGDTMPFKCQAFLTGSYVTAFCSMLGRYDGERVYWHDGECLELAELSLIIHGR